MMNTPIKYIAEPKHVREVSLLGSADLDYWTDRLRVEDLEPAAFDGKAQLLIVAAEMKFMGVRFQELSFSVLVRRDEYGIQHNGAYPVQAFNTCWFFAFCERNLFGAPYVYGDVSVSTGMPAYIQLTQRGNLVFRVEMHAGGKGATREPSRHGEGGWQGAIFLPRRGRKNDQGKLFFGKIAGITRTYPFLPDKDELVIVPSPESVILQALNESHVVVQEWAIS